MTGRSRIEFVEIRDTSRVETADPKDPTAQTRLSEKGHRYDHAGE